MRGFVQIRSRLAAPAGEVWARVVTEEGINDELRPWLRMTMPAGLEGATIDDVPVGESLGRSWILLLGLVPVDYDDLRLAELEPRRRFVERSRTLALRPWQHERVVEPAGDGACTVTDRLAFEVRPALARVPGAARIAAAIVGALFRHRHRRLAARFGHLRPDPMTPGMPGRAMGNRRAALSRSGRRPWRRPTWP